jgi:predicted Zn-dependent peptidase
MNYTRTVLPNGLRLLMTPMSGMRSASIAFFFSVGSRYEPSQIAGISHFIEHMLFKGSKRYPSAKLLSEAIEGVGGMFNGSTGKELTCYTARIPGEYLPHVLEVLADMVRYPLIDAAEVEKERAVIIEEISASQDDPQELGGLAIEEQMWPNLPLGRDDAGTIETVSTMQRQQLLDHMDQFYRPNGLVISIAGNIDTQQVQHLVERLFSDWQPGKLPNWTPCPPPHKATPVRIITKDTEQTTINLATFGTAYGTTDYYPLMVANGLLGDGMSSRLFQSIREEQGLAYDIGSYFNSYRETGNLVISGGVDPERSGQAISAIVAELEKLRTIAVPADELERIKAYVRGGFLLGMEGTQQVASWLGSQECLYNRIHEIDEIIAHVDAVTAQDVQHVAKTCFAPDWRRLVIVGPEKDQRTAYFEQLLTGV